MALLLIWSVWLFFGRIPLYVTSDAARLEAEQAAHPVAATEGGRVTATFLRNGRHIAAGAVLVELDAADAYHLHEQSRRLLDGLDAQLPEIRRQIHAEEAALAAHGSAWTAAVEEARSRARESDTEARLAESEGNRLTQLSASGAVTPMQLERVQLQAQAYRAAAAASLAAAERLHHEAQREDSDRRRRLAELRSMLTRAEAERAAYAVQVEQTRDRLERRRIVAPISGELGDAAQLEVGSVVTAGQVLGAIIPAGPVHVRAVFPAAALGRVRVGQRARLRLDGYPWTEFGSLAARVVTVSAESQQGRFVAHLALQNTAVPVVPLVHGLPGTVEIQVERAAPFTVMLRAVGRGHAAAARTEAGGS